MFRACASIETAVPYILHQRLYCSTAASKRKERESDTHTHTKEQRNKTFNHLVFSLTHSPLLPPPLSSPLSPLSPPSFPADFLRRPLRRHVEAAAWSVCARGLVADPPACRRGSPRASPPRSIGAGAVAGGAPIRRRSVGRSPPFCTPDKRRRKRGREKESQRCCDTVTSTLFLSLLRSVPSPPFSSLTRQLVLLSCRQASSRGRARERRRAAESRRQPRARRTSAASSARPGRGRQCRCGGKGRGALTAVPLPDAGEATEKGQAARARVRVKEREVFGRRPSFVAASAA